MTSKEYEKLEKKLQESCARIGEDFDSIIILATVGDTNNQNKCALFNVGCGNYYAQYGMIKDWVVRRETETCKDTINIMDSQEIEDDTDEGEDAK